MLPAVSAPATALLPVCLLLLAPVPCRAAKAYTHGWDTVADSMAMHGKFNPLEKPADTDIQFVAKHYPGMITTGTGCPMGWNETSDTIEQSVQDVAVRIKKVNPAAKVGMYWRADTALELSQCSGFKDEWAAHPEWRLKDDNGNDVMKGSLYYQDYLQPAAAAFFAKVLLNVTMAKLPSGKPVLDYLYIDGAGGCNLAGAGCKLRPYANGISQARSAKIQAAKYAMLSHIQSAMDARGLEQVLVLNGMDNAATAAAHVATGAAGSMFDHWSILQFIDKQTGAFNQSMMEEGFALVNSKTLSNVTTQIKGWVGPVVEQEGHYPPSMHTPTTPAERLKVAAERFNSELALFLLVATEQDFWIYSWFWGWFDYVGGNPLSTVPKDFFPEAKCKLGAPAGLMKKGKAAGTFTREFAHASVFVDLGNRTNSKVAFTSC